MINDLSGFDLVPHKVQVSFRSYIVMKPVNMPTDGASHATRQYITRHIMVPRVENRSENPRFEGKYSGIGETRFRFRWFLLEVDNDIGAAQFYDSA